MGLRGNGTGKCGFGADTKHIKWMPEESSNKSTRDKELICSIRNFASVPQTRAWCQDQANVVSLDRQRRQMVTVSYSDYARILSKKKTHRIPLASPNEEAYASIKHPVWMGHANNNAEATRPNLDPVSSLQRASTTASKLLLGSRTNKKGLS
ncbi:MAG: hypothetical protein Q9163_004526 [Psora crenata]